MKRIKDYIINNMFKIEYNNLKSEKFPFGTEVRCGNIQLGNWKTTYSTLDISNMNSYLNWEQHITKRAQESQIQQFELAFPNNFKMLMGYVVLKLKNAFKAFIKKFSKVS